jgi:hypothetical protein
MTLVPYMPVAAAQMTLRLTGGALITGDQLRVLQASPCPCCGAPEGFLCARVGNNEQGKPWKYLHFARINYYRRTTLDPLRKKKSERL